MEIGEDRTNFLDTTIIKNNNKLIFDWLIPILSKTYSCRYL